MPTFKRLTYTLYIIKKLQEIVLCHQNNYKTDLFLAYINKSSSTIIKYSNINNQYKKEDKLKNKQY